MKKLGEGWAWFGVFSVCQVGLIVAISEWCKRQKDKQEGRER